MLMDLSVVRFPPFSNSSGPLLAMTSSTEFILCILVLANGYERIILASLVAIDASQGIVKISHIHADWSNLYVVEWVSWLRYHCSCRVSFIGLLLKALWQDLAHRRIPWHTLAIRLAPCGNVCALLFEEVNQIS
ncbi:uncharacterized protein LOC127076768 [Lathyrus oleraceus]|uniref:uncharacterized protein LOC127076768 n=1 Tax=Pisum sativum TaxID=3888 RepID=UPI0021CE76A4|nr:uncharacterized protein LOC127076768 [Pisum sativum]XP_050874516.1 uncharacterized protein LOC127076768 [Pisum sativum]